MKSASRSYYCIGKKNTLELEFMVNNILKLMYVRAKVTANQGTCNIVPLLTIDPADQTHSITMYYPADCDVIRNFSGLQN